MHKGAIFPLFYLPPIEYFNKILSHKDEVLIESDEHFPKQTYRNRAVIHSANGPLNLIIPVLKGSNVHTKIKDVQISYEFDWQRLHWLSLQTSYRSSAFFEFYEDDLAPFYENKTKFLFDFNEQLFQLLLKLLKINVSYNKTAGFEKDYAELSDYRSNIHPKLSSDYQPKPYFQVFEERNGFLPNVSIADLLFNQGPQSVKYI